MRQEFRGPRGLIGSLDIDSEGNVTVYSSTNMILGRYVASRDVTVDFYGTIVAHGKCPGMLFSSPENPYNNQ